MYYKVKMADGSESGNRCLASVVTLGEASTDQLTKANSGTMVNSYWMSAVKGLYYLKEGLECFCDEVVKKQHDHLMTQCGRSCTECNLKTLKPNHNCIIENNIKRCPLGPKKCNCLKSNQAPPLNQCPNETCGVIYDEIINIHGSTPPAPNWRNTDIKQWYSNQWAIATCCIKVDGYRGRTSAAEFDCSGLLSIIINDKAFLDHLDCDVDGEDAFSEAVRIRNTLFHSPNGKISEKDAHRYIRAMIDVLKDGKELSEREESRLAVEKLNDLIEWGVDMSQDIELVNKVEILSKKLTSLESEQQRKTDASNEKLLEATRALQSLESYLLLNENEEGNAIEDAEIRGCMLEAIKSDDHSRAISLLKEWIENICSLKQQDDIRIRATCQTDGNAVQTQYEMPTVRRPHDGRLITLTKEDVRGILSNCDTVLEGGFGEAHVSSTHVPGLDLRVVIKKILKEGEDEIKMLSVSNEKIASRVMHFAIVPLIAYMDEVLGEDKRAFYFLTPYLEKGNLLEVIASDKKCSDTKDIQLKLYIRIGILFQVACALDYLHTPVPNYRGIILHMDLTSTNIVLDSFMNARLIDFGLAREMNEGQTKITYTQSKCLGKPGYYPTSRYSKLTVHEDYYNFGVVIRELLTGDAPYVKNGNGCTELRKCDEKLISKICQRNIWNGSKYVKDLVSLSTRCLTSRKEKLCSAKIVKALENMHSLRRDFTRADEDKCHICMVNPTGVHLPQHGCRMKVCVSCMRNSHVNPIKCPICNGDVIPKTGHTTAALLIAGNDIKDQKFANSFKNEIEEIKGVLVSKCPCVIGCRKENVRLVTSSNPGKPDQLHPSLSEAINFLKQRKGLETLLLYFTGHHYPESGFHLGGPEEILTLKYLQEALIQISKRWGSQTRILVFLDCCYPPSVAGSIPDISNASLKIIQINACRPCEFTDQPESGSTFQRFFIQALTRRSFNKQCHNTSTGNDCVDCKMTDDFITIEKLHKYISDHMAKRFNEKQPAMYAHGITWLDASIGYNVDFVVYYEFKFGEQSIPVKLAHSIFYEIKDLKKKILENVIAVNDEQSTEKLTPVEFSDAIALRIHTGSEDGQELRSMLNVSSAMDGKREIVASYRTISNILNGPVVLFVPTERIIQYLDDKTFDGKKLLKNTDEGRKTATLSLHELDLVTVDIAEITDLEEIRKCFLNVEIKLGQEKNKNDMELNFVFPCIDDGKCHDFMMLHITTKPRWSLQLLNKIRNCKKDIQLRYFLSVVVLIFASVLVFLFDIKT